jgi:predicted nucleic acid-binding Zn ribbon protein
MTHPIECPRCAAPIPPPAKVCLNCGHLLVSKPTPEEALRGMRASRLTVKILAVLLAVYMLAVVGTFIYDHLL